MTLTLRTADIDDAGVIAELLIRSRTVIYRGVLPDHYIDGALAADVRAHWQARMPAFAAGDGTVVVAERDDRMIAFVALFEPDDRASVYVDNLHVLPDRKGTGAGSALLDAARGWAEGRGARAMHLRVLEANRPAARFYEARGWQFTGRSDDDMGGIPVVVRHYRLPLAVRDASSPTD